MQCSFSPSGLVHVVLGPLWHSRVDARQSPCRWRQDLNMSVFALVANPGVKTVRLSAAPGAALASIIQIHGVPSSSWSMRWSVSSHHIWRMALVWPLWGACATKNQHTSISAWHLTMSLCASLWQTWKSWTLRNCGFRRLSWPTGCRRLTQSSTPYWPLQCPAPIRRISWEVLKTSSLRPSCTPTTLRQWALTCSKR